MANSIMCKEATQKRNLRVIQQARTRVVHEAILECAPGCYSPGTYNLGKHGQQLCSGVETKNCTCSRARQAKLLSIISARGRKKCYFVSPVNPKDAYFNAREFAAEWSIQVSNRNQSLQTLT
jgi:hypothetical protein